MKWSESETPDRLLSVKLPIHPDVCSWHSTISRVCSRSISNSRALLPANSAIHRLFDHLAFTLSSAPCTQVPRLLRCPSPRISTHAVANLMCVVPWGVGEG